MDGVTRKTELCYALIAHGAFIVAIILNEFRHESTGVVFYIFSIGVAIFGLPSFSYFLISWKTFFLQANEMTRKTELIHALMAHAAFFIAIILDGFSRESTGVVSYIFLIGTAIFILHSLIYFGLNPRSFFLQPNGMRGERRLLTGKVQKIAVCFASWIYVVSWPTIWLLFVSFSDWSPRLVACYSFMFGIMSSLLVGKYLFFWKNDKEKN